jgi:competence protein ComFC
VNKLSEYPAILLDIISPRRCLLCACHLNHPLTHKKSRQKVLGDYLCSVCQEQLNICVIDSTELLQVDKVFSGYRYSGSLAQIIPAWKYHGHTEFSPLIEVLTQQLIYRSKLSEYDFDLVMAIPLTRSSLRKRGFNQALFIASCCANVLGLPLLKHQFTKVVDTPHQASLDRAARARNLNSDVFRVARTVGLENQNILLCDDVLTTGSTLKAAATALKNAGANSVSAITLARVE